MHDQLNGQQFEDPQNEASSLNLHFSTRSVLGFLAVIDLIEGLRVASRAFGVEVGEEEYGFARGFEVERSATVTELVSWSVEGRYGSTYISLVALVRARRTWTLW